MTAQITHVRFHGYRKHEDIAVYKWRLDTGESGESDRASMLAWLEQGNDAVVAADGAWAAVGVVRVAGQQPFLCTHVNGQWTDALLNLPMF
jgi:hypothetical protein